MKETWKYTAPNGMIVESHGLIGLLIKYIWRLICGKSRTIIK